MTRKELMQLLDKGRKTDGLYYQNKPLLIGQLFLSVQASKFHYCSPKENIASNEEYSLFEIAIMDNTGKFYGKEDLSLLHGFRFMGGKIPVHVYVPVNKIVKLVTALEKLQGSRAALED